MKFVLHQVGLGDPHILRKRSVHGATEICGQPPRIHPYAHRLPPRVHSGVCSARAKRGYRTPAQATQGVLEYPLYCAHDRLPLPPREPRAVVMENQLDGARRHRVETYRRRLTCQAKQITEPIDFARRTPQRFRSDPPR
ncbi:MAG: hypothetical protein NVS1B4_11040 [Gemmatimonadaceae bacterium]